MRHSRVLMITGATALLIANAAAAPAVCTGHGKFGPLQTVKGSVVELQTDQIGFTHVIVNDTLSGCRVAVLASDHSDCKAGQQFEASGRLRSDFKGTGYDATLDAGRSGGRCL